MCCHVVMFKSYNTTNTIYDGSMFKRYSNINIACSLKDSSTINIITMIASSYYS